MNRALVKMAMIAVALFTGPFPAQAEINVTTCRFPKLTRSLIMPEIKVLFDSTSNTVTIDDALIREVVGKPISARVENRRNSTKVLFIVNWRVERLPPQRSPEYSYADFVLKVERTGRAVIESQFPSPFYSGQVAVGDCS